MNEMYRVLSDLRLLRLASHLEQTLEGYAEYLRDGIPEVPVRAKLAVLFEAGPYHRRLRQALLALEKWVGSDPAPRETETILQILFECERIARDFYLHQLDHPSDPVLVEIFRGMAEEETRHMEAVRDAMSMAHQLAVERQAARPFQGA